MRKDQGLLAACLGFMGGVFVGSFFSGAWWMILLGAAFFVAFAFIFSQKNICLLLVSLILFAWGVFSVEKAAEHFQEGNMQGGEIRGIARITDDPEEKSFYRQTLLRMESCESEYCPEEKILWQAPRTENLVSGARLEFSCVLEMPKNFDAAFDYRMFLAKDNIGYLCRKALRAELKEEDARARFTRLFFIPKRALEKALEKSLPQPEAGLAEGLIIGGDNRLSAGLKQAFVKAGLSHIVAISGYNIALIAQGFVILGIALGLWRRQALWFAALGIILFIVFVGAPASAVRAGIMGLTVFAALFFGRLTESVNILLLAAVLMLLFEPLLLRYDVGFQLSFLATLAIIVALPFIERLLPREFFGKSLLEIALLTFSVELMVVPMLVYQFHTFSPFALFANVLLLPLVPYAMAASFVSGLAFFLVPGLHIIPALLAYFFLRIITFSAEEISAWPGAAVEISLGGGMLLLWYLLLFLAIVLGRVRLRKRLQKEMFTVSESQSFQDNKKP